MALLLFQFKLKCKSAELLCKFAHFGLVFWIGLPAFVFNTLVSGCFRGFSNKKRLNARGFVQEFLQSSMLYRPGKSLKRRDKSCSLHSKKNFCLWGAGFL